MSFDKLAGIYVYCMNYHTGQWSRLYRIMSRISGFYKLRLKDSIIHAIEDKECDPYNDYSIARDIYETLIKNHEEQSY